MTIVVDQTDRVVAGAGATLRLQPVDAQGTPVQPEAPVAVSVFSAGEPVAAAEAAVEGTELVATLPPIGILDTYSVRWSAVVDGAELDWQTRLEVAGGHYFSLASFRAARPDCAAFGDRQVAEARRVAEDTIEAACRCAFVPRGAREGLIATGRGALPLAWPEPRELYSLTIDGVPLTADRLAEVVLHPGGMLLDAKGWPAGGRVLVHYSHGLDAPPSPVRRAAILLARELLVPSDLPARATVLATDVGSFRLTVAGRDGATGIPEVDAVIAEYSRRRPEVG